MNETSAPAQNRRLPIGAEVLPEGGIHFRVWAPRCAKVEVLIERGADLLSLELASEPNGYFSGLFREAKAGDLYRYRLNGGEKWAPDPASRFQPHGPSGPSMIVDPAAFRWQDQAWSGLHVEGQVIYEMHVGTFTTEGSWQAAARELAALKELGITAIELMPVHDFSGSFGWGYDSVDYFAPTRLYGSADDFRAFVDQAHRLGLGVILDVVYNHAGPVGNFFKEFATAYFSDRYSTDWGEAFNFDGAESGPVREFFIANAGYWIEEFHLDGLRLDATQNIYDASEKHILAAINDQVRRAAGERSTILIAENEPQETKLVRPAKEGGYGLNSLWNDDFHHSAVVALTKHNEAYYSDYLGKPQELISAAKHGYLYQGQHYVWQKQRRGHSTHGLSPSAFINYLQNHDQIANLGLGHRIHQLTDPGMYRAMTTLLLLAPQTPMLFQGQEFAATTPFLYFADHEPELAAKVKQGRLEFLSQFPSLASARMKQRLPDPTDPAVFASCRLDFAERERNHQALALHRDLLRLRREDPVFKVQRPGGVDGAVLGDETFVLRFFAAHAIDRLLLVNLGMDVHLRPVPEPLLAPPGETPWQVLWSSEDPHYGGLGALPSETTDDWFIPGKGAFVLAPAL